MSQYRPDCWRIVKFVSAYGDYKKVLSGWYGGFANGDSWRLSSGITNIEEHDDHYLITNESGSVYTCYKYCERMSNIMYSKYQEWVNEADEAGKLYLNSPMSIELLDIDEIK